MVQLPGKCNFQISAVSSKWVMVTVDRDCICMFYSMNYLLVLWEFVSREFCVAFPKGVTNTVTFLPSLLFIFTFSGNFCDGNGSFY